MDATVVLESETVIRVVEIRPAEELTAAVVERDLRSGPW
jgi:hypothetical protein